MPQCARADSFSPEPCGEGRSNSKLSRFFFYDHWKELPFCPKIGRSVKPNSRGLRRRWKQKGPPVANGTKSAVEGALIILTYEKKFEQNQ